jgi:hypothetical protein
VSGFAGAESGKCVKRVHSRGADGHLLAVTFQGSRDPSADKGGLAAAGRADDGQHTLLAESVQTGCHVGVAAEKALGVLHVVRGHGYAAASLEAPAPTLFASGNTPPFLASGLDPAVLNRLPYKVRHYAASLRDKDQLLQLIEEVGDDPDAMMPHPALTEYEQRVKRWASGADAAKPAKSLAEILDPEGYQPTEAEQARADADDALYNQLYGDQSDTDQARRAARNQAQADALRSRRP